MFVCDGGVSTPLILIRVNNQPLLLQEMLFLSQCAVRPASAIASSQIPECSQLSDIIITEQSFIGLFCVNAIKSNSSVLLLSDSVCEEDTEQSRIMG